MGMVGGGKDAFIGAIHRIAANSDGLIELVCGALSINKEIAIDSGHSLFLPEDRIYTTYEEMIEKESKLGDDKRMDFVTIVTPNFAHFAPAMLALDKGFHVVIEKPMRIQDCCFASRIHILVTQWLKKQGSLLRMEPWERSGKFM